MPGGTIKVDVSIKQWWKTGQHALISIPSISFGQSHPYTIAAQSAEPMRFFVRDIGPGGFSSKLNQSTSSKAYTVLIQGPYGAIPRLDRYDEIIFVAGGAGATWTVPLMKEFIARSKCDEKGIVKGTFIWSVRSEDCLSWFSNELIEAVYAGVDIRLFNTRQSKNGTGKTGHTPKSRFTVYQGRPNIRLLLTDVLSKVKSTSVAVVVCGPSKMVNDSRFAVSESLLETAIPIGLFIEEF
ncbi:Ferric reductase transmembrane component 5 [Neolecta irregularis DAH-3]|uniref:ferric-chelate reductase (NADPH) n=1 Tax=Neolecta irregularis (strain DAH-3) TaxID=1198029 RepID=A0A1U7LLM4_NEOID|nr:Ferric reductase transmembrane component 5 [Neolecta irregularis DAH-3]|eukprot:OLL23560.1 Ferric reductase transmembrane component 5 [Neolecta irregularis DAH-3]